MSDLFGKEIIEIDMTNSISIKEKPLLNGFRNLKTIQFKFRDISDSYPEIKNKREKISKPETLYNNFHSIFDNEVQEKFVVFWLNSINNVIGFEEISKGSLDSTVCTAREVFRGAIVASCSNIILAHNHPSGNKEPSSADITMTKKLVEAGKVIGINVFDHIIFTNEGYLSLVEKRLM